MFSKKNKQIKIPGIYGRLRGNKGSSFQYESSNLSKNKEERVTLTYRTCIHLKIRIQTDKNRVFMDLALK